MKNRKSYYTKGNLVICSDSSTPINFKIVGATSLKTPSYTHLNHYQSTLQDKYLLHIRIGHYFTITTIGN